MSISLYDAMDDLLNLLSTKWTSSGGEKPEIVKVWDKKTTGFGDDFRDQIILDPQKEIISTFSLHADSFLSEVPITIDVRTYSGEKRHNAMMKEIGRILEHDVRTTTGYVDRRIVGFTSFNREYRNMFRATIDVIYRQVHSI